MKLNLSCHRFIGLACLLIFGSILPRIQAQKPALPEGASGIAARYPGDQGMAKDPDVILAEDFNVASLDTVFKRWASVKNKSIMSISSDVPNGSRDRRSLLMTHVGGESSGGHLYNRLPKNEDLVFARFYVKFDPSCGPIHHFGTHLGGFNPSTPWPQGGAGLKPDGKKRFTSGVEPFGKDWGWDFYSYWQGMHVHGDGRYWGTPFLVGAKKPNVKRGQWICVEMMLKMNQPVAASNGAQAFWIDGKLWRDGNQIVSHIGKGFPKGRWTGGWWRPEGKSKTSFEGFQWRTDPALAVNYIWTYLYITKAPKGHVSKVWFDNIVAARKYIGPIKP